MKFFLPILLLFSCVLGGNQHRSVSGFRSFVQCTVTVAGKYHQDVFAIDTAFMGDSLQRIVYADSLGNHLYSWWGLNRASATCTTWVKSADSLSVGKTFRRYYYKPGQSYTGNIYGFFIDGDDFSDGKTPKHKIARNQTIEDTIAADAHKYEAGPTLGRSVNKKYLYCALHVQDTNMHGPDTSGRVEFLRSSDKGQNWTKIYTHNKDSASAGVVSMIVYPKNGIEYIVLVLTWMYNSGNDRTVSSFSTDSGVTWSSYSELVQDTVTSGRGSMAMLSNDTLLAVLYNYAFKSLFFCRSGNHGQTWTYTAVANPTAISLDEASVIELKTGGEYRGKVQCVVRNETAPNTYKKITSTDYGKTWGTYTDNPFTSLKNPTWITRLNPPRDSVVVAMFGDNLMETRYSTDECSTWTSTPVWRGTNWSARRLYPSIVDDDSGLIVSMCTNHLTGTPPLSDAFFYYYPYPHEHFLKNSSCPDGKLPTIANGVLTVAQSECNANEIYSWYMTNGYTSPITFVTRVRHKDVYVLLPKQTGNPIDGTVGYLLANQIGIGSYGTNYSFATVNSDVFRRPYTHTENAWSTIKMDVTNTHNAVYNDGNLTLYKTADSGSGLCNYNVQPLWGSASGVAGAYVDIDWYYVRPYTVIDPNTNKSAEQKALRLSTSYPESGAAGSSINITGWNLSTGTTIYVGPSSANKTTSTDSSATITVSAGAGTQSIIAVSDDGQSDTLVFAWTYNGVSQKKKNILFFFRARRK